MFAPVTFSIVVLQQMTHSIIIVNKNIKVIELLFKDGENIRIYN